MNTQHMKQITSLLSVGLLSIVLFCAGCGRNVPDAAPPPPVVSVPRFTPENYDKITIGMSKAEVEKVLGPPTSSGERQMLVFGGDQSKWDPVLTYRYEDGQKFAEIIFKTDKVEKKNTNLDGR
jgi:outer membrane protein assembly factor BamE (lipoprotein component of BamABCDE complex)